MKSVTGKTEVRKHKTYERDIYMEEKKEELETSADTEVKEETELQASESSENASAASEPEKRKDLRQISDFCFLPEYIFFTQDIISAQT